MSNNLTRDTYRYVLWRKRKKAQTAHRDISGMDMKLNMVI